MAKALAVEVAGFRSVSGARKEFLALKGFYVFRFTSKSHADEFCKAVTDYIASNHAHVA